MRFKITKTSGVYHLLHEGEIVYVGSSIFCEKRIFEHFKDKVFDDVFIQEIKLGMIDCEAEDIAKYKPKYNKSIPICNSIFSRERYLLKFTGIEKIRIRKLIKSKAISIAKIHGVEYYYLKTLESLCEKK
jgi:hypothetical protein